MAKKGIQLQTANQLIKILPNNFKYRSCSRTNMGLLFRTSLKNRKQRMANLTRSKVSFAIYGKKPKGSQRNHYCIFFSCDGIVVQILVARGKICYRSMLPRFFLLVYKKFRKDINHKRHPVSVFRHVCSIHDNLTLHHNATSKLVNDFLKS